jgi:hypothetical protein
MLLYRTVIGEIADSIRIDVNVAICSLHDRKLTSDSRCPLAIDKIMEIMEGDKDMRKKIITLNPANFNPDILDKALLKVPFAIEQLRELSRISAKLSGNDDPSKAAHFYEAMLGLIKYDRTIWDLIIYDEFPSIRFSHPEYWLLNRYGKFTENVKKSIHNYKVIDKFINNIWSYFQNSEYRKIYYLANILTLNNSPYDKHMLIAIANLLNIKTKYDKESLCASILSHFMLHFQLGLPILAE